MPRSLPTGCPPHTQWGQVDQARQIADGWWSVCTPSHGGHVLSRDRWMQMPEYLRETTYSRGGQFEEDCDWCLPVVYFHDEFATYMQWGDNHQNYPADYDPIEAAWKTFQRWHPEAYARYKSETNIVGMNLRGITYDSAACAAAQLA